MGGGEKARLELRPLSYTGPLNDSRGIGARDGKGEGNLLIVAACGAVCQEGYTICGFFDT
jgi:hypothetical protein